MALTSEYVIIGNASADKTVTSVILECLDTQKIIIIESLINGLQGRLFSYHLL